MDFIYKKLESLEFQYGENGKRVNDLNNELQKLQVESLKLLGAIEILKELLEIEEITNIWRLSGDCGLFMKVEIESIEKFNPLIEEKISQIKGVKIVETCFITDVIK